MKPAGELAFSLRTEKRSGIYAYEKEPVDLTPDFKRQFKKNKVAWEFFNAQPPSYKKVIIHGIMSAKQEKTQLSRLEKAITFSAEQKRIL